MKSSPKTFSENNFLERTDYFGNFRNKTFLNFHVVYNSVCLSFLQPMLQKLGGDILGQSKIK